MLLFFGDGRRTDVWMWCGSKLITTATEPILVLQVVPHLGIGDIRHCLTGVSKPFIPPGHPSSQRPESQAAIHVGTDPVRYFLSSVMGREPVCHPDIVVSQLHSPHIHHLVSVRSHTINVLNEREEEGNRGRMGARTREGKKGRSKGIIKKRRNWEGKWWKRSKEYF